MKKKLSVLLCLALLVTLFTVPAVAEDELPYLEITWAGHADTTPPAEEGTPYQKYL